MNLTIGIAKHGWLPIRLTIDSSVYEFQASNVFNDPFEELLAAAVWVLDSEFELPPPTWHSPLVGDGFRCVHFSRERNCHTLKIQRAENSNKVLLVFYYEHDSPTGARGDDLRTSRFTRFEHISAMRFARAVHSAVTDVVSNQPMPEFDRLWRHPINWGLYSQLSMFVDAMDQAE